MAGWVYDNEEEEVVEVLIHHVIDGTGGEIEQLKEILLRTFLFAVKHCQGEAPLLKEFMITKGEAKRRNALAKRLIRRGRLFENVREMVTIYE
jgi:hypothetical protein